MKKDLLSRIDYEIGKLEESDVSSHIWWNKFRAIVSDSPETGEQQELEIDLKNLTVKHDHYRFGDKK